MRRRPRFLALAVLIVLSGCRREAEPPPLLLPGFAEAVPSLTQLQVAQGDEVLDLARGEGPWRIIRGAWRVDRRWLQPLLLGLSEARCDEVRTKDPARFDRIGVAWPVVADATSGDGAFARPTGRLSMRIDGRDQAIVIGHAHPRGGTYVRVEGTAHACLTHADLRLPAQASQWFDPQLWQLPIERVERVRVEDPGRPALALVRREGGFAVEGQLLALSPLPDALVAALAAPRQTDLRAAATDAVAQRVLHLEAGDGIRYGLALRDEGDRTWAVVIDAPTAEVADFRGREFLLPREVAEPLRVSLDALGGP